MRPLLAVLPFVILLAACGSGESGNRTPQGGSVTDGAPPSASDRPLYIALGDSLSEGRGASFPRETAFVPLVHEGLSGDFELLNLGVAGHTSDDLIAGPLNVAVQEIGRRNKDGDDGNDVRLVTLEIGGNDLLGLYDRLVITGLCPALEQSLPKPECTTPLRQTLDFYRDNLTLILDRLLEADGDLKLLVMTLYNPFSGGGLTTIADLADLALDGMADTPFPEGLNDIVREEAAARGLPLVDWYELMYGEAEYVGFDLIHPNDDGYRVMADAVLDAARDEGIAVAGG